VRLGSGIEKVIPRVWDARASSWVRRLRDLRDGASCLRESRDGCGLVLRTCRWVLGRLTLLVGWLFFWFVSVQRVDMEMCVN